MSLSYVQSMVNCGTATVTVAGFSSVDWSTNGSDWTTVSVTGWLPFKDYLSTVSAALPSALSITYNTSTDRCVVEVSDSTTYHVRWTASTAKLLGFNSTTVATGGSDTAGDYGPKGLCPLLGVHFANPRPAKKSTPRTFRHGVSHSTSFGSGTLYDIRATINHDDRERLQEGPCSIGKVRIGSWTSSSVYSSSALGGYLDAFLVQQPSIAPADTVENSVFCDFIALSPAAAHNTSDSIGDAVYGSLKRGYSLNYSCRVEGLPYIFVEKSTGISSSRYPHHTESATLVVSSGTTLTQKIERQKGIIASTGLKIGILDPENSLGLFKRPTLKIALGADLAHNGTTATIDQDSGATSDWPSGGASTASFYLGKEFIKYGAKATANFSSLTRGHWGPVYEFKSKGPGSFKTLSDTPTVWRGRVVELWAILTDPFGAAVASDFDDSYTIAVFTGDLNSQPGFDSGVWVLNCRDLARRLGTSTGVTASGKVSAQRIPNDVGTTLLKIDTDTEVQLLYRLSHPNASKDAFESEILDAWYLINAANGTNVWAAGGTEGYVDIRSLITSTFWRCKNTSPSWSSIGDYSTQYLGWHTDFGYGSSDGNFRLGSDGIEFDYWAHNKSGADAYGVTLTVIYHSKGNDKQTPLFEYTVTSSGLGIGQQWEKTAETAKKVSGKAVNYLMVKEAAASDSLSGTFASSGYLVVGSGKDAELVQYTAKESTLWSGVVCFTGLTRGVGNTPRADFFDDSLAVHQAHREDAVALGDLMAKVVESSGIAASLRGDFDDFTEEGVGYGIDEDHVLDSGSGLSPAVQTKVMGGHCGFPPALSVVLSGKQMTFEKMFGGLLAAKKRAVAWVRAGQRLKLGVVRTVASASHFETVHTVDEDDLQLAQSARIAEISTPPNIIHIDRVPTMLDDSKDTVTVRLVPDIAARGGRETKLSLYGLNSVDFIQSAQSLAMGLIEETGSSVAYEMKVAGWRDWLPGDLVKFDSIENGGLWDWTSDSSGLDCYGRVVEVRRDLTAGGVTLKVLVEGQGFVQLLCPVATVTANSSNLLTVDSVEYFRTGDPALVYTPGVAGSYEELTISSINTSTNVLTMSATPSSVTNNITVVSYPSSDNSSITTVQDSHAHVGDGGQWD